ncbi:hypothetical protein [Cryobacterium sp. 10I5]|uniref:hypothetical protein n=1 Tax=Cryobacterium sp. 10I5 TaxID=3048581 RepID=UPI002B22F307|nr:hypothetical protein [Cryobacterium sp. 10I5]MEB0265727.1 hypothetical protein [Cryobacterium sp. 10I5]
MVDAAAAPPELSGCAASPTPLASRRPSPPDPGGTSSGVHSATRGPTRRGRIREQATESTATARSANASPPNHGYTPGTVSTGVAGDPAAFVGAPSRALAPAPPFSQVPTPTVRRLDRMSPTVSARVRNTAGARPCHASNRSRPRGAGYRNTALAATQASMPPRSASSVIEETWDTEETAAAAPWVAPAPAAPSSPCAGGASPRTRSAARCVTMASRTSAVCHRAPAVRAIGSTGRVRVQNAVTRAARSRAPATRKTTPAAVPDTPVLTPPAPPARAAQESTEVRLSPAARWASESRWVSPRRFHRCGDSSSGRGPAGDAAGAPGRPSTGRTLGPAAAGRAAR